MLLPQYVTDMLYTLVLYCYAQTIETIANIAVLHVCFINKFYMYV
jgi:hypothetical protein